MKKKKKSFCYLLELPVALWDNCDPNKVPTSARLLTSHSWPPSFKLQTDEPVRPVLPMKPCWKSVVSIGLSLFWLLFNLLYVAESLVLDHFLASLSLFYGYAYVSSPKKSSLISENHVLDSVHIYFIPLSITHRAGHTKALNINTRNEYCCLIKSDLCSYPIWPPGKESKATH